MIRVSAAPRSNRGGVAVLIVLRDPTDDWHMVFWLLQQLGDLYDAERAVMTAYGFGDLPMTMSPDPVDLSWPPPG